MALSTSRTLTSRGLPPRLAGGIIGAEPTPRPSDHLDNEGRAGRRIGDVQASIWTDLFESSRAQSDHIRFIRLNKFLDPL
jgi:hypothetical protein